MRVRRAGPTWRLAGATRHLAFALLVLIAPTLAWADETPVRLDALAPVSLSPVGRWVSDPQMRHSVETVLAIARSAPGTPRTGVDRSAAVSWLVVDIVNDTDLADWQVRVRQAFFGRFDFWVVTDGLIAGPTTVGMALDDHTAQPNFAMGYILPAPIEPGATATLVLRVEPILPGPASYVLAPGAWVDLQSSLRRVLFPLLLGGHVTLAIFHIVLFTRFGRISNLLFAGSLLAVFANWFIWLGGANDLGLVQGLAATQVVESVTWIAATLLIFNFVWRFFVDDVGSRRLDIGGPLAILVSIAASVLLAEAVPAVVATSILLLGCTIPIFFVGVAAIRRGAAGAPLALFAFGLSLTGEMAIQVCFAVPGLEDVGDWLFATLGLYDWGSLVIQIVANGLFSVALLERVRSDKARQETTLRQERQRTVELAQLCHDVRTPLHAVQNIVGLLAIGEAGAPDDGEAARHARAAIRTMTGVLDEMSALVRVDRVGAGARKPCGLREIVMDAVLVVRGEIGARPVAVTFAITDEMEAARPEDPIALRRVLVNILSNAAAATASGTVHLTIDRHGTRAERMLVTARDSGMGLSPARLRSLFGAAGPAPEEPGIGLRVVHRLIAEVGGRLQAASVRGDGTTLTVEWPLWTTAAEPDTAAIPAKLRVLVVEDDPLAARATVALLLAEGHVARLAGSPADASAIIAAEAIDMILVDLELGQTTGLSVLEAVREIEDPVLAAVPIVLASGSPMAESKAHALGFSAVLRKPFDRDALRAALAAATGDALPAEAVQDASLSALLSPAAFGSFMTTAQEQIQRLCEAIDGAVARSDVRAVAEAAHRVAGAAGFAELPRLAETARALESAARSADLEALAQAYRSLDQAHAEAANVIATRLASVGIDTITATQSSAMGPGRRLTSR